MKKLFLYIVLLGLLNSCNYDDGTKLIDEVSSSEKEMIFDKPSAIDKEEVPELDQFYYSKDSSNFSFAFDDSRNAIFNQSLSQLRVPVSQTSLQANLANSTNIADNNSGTQKFCICIARMRESQGCYYCVNCLGFRCKNCCDDGIPPFEPQSRSQPAIVTYDEVSQEIVFQFAYAVDWEYLKT